VCESEEEAETDRRAEFCQTVLSASHSQLRILQQSYQVRSISSQCLSTSLYQTCAWIVCPNPTGLLHSRSNPFWLNLFCGLTASHKFFSHTRAPCLNRSMHLDAIWQVHLWGPVTHCVRWGSLTTQGKLGRFGFWNPQSNCHIVRSVLPPATNDQLCGLATAILPFAKLLWFLLLLLLSVQ